MTCANHFELEASAYCRECGKPMCAECQRPALGSVYCAQHVPAPAAGSASGVSATATANPSNANPAFMPQSAPPPAAPPLGMTADPAFLQSPYTAPTGTPPRGGGPSPALAFILGFIFPGVGAIYNGQYAKGLVHAVIFGVMVSIISSGGHSSFEPLLGILLAIWIFYMAFEAYHTARKRRMGFPVDEFSSMVNLKPTNGRFPAGAIVLIGLGVVLLSDSLGIFRLQSLIHFWPVGLIVLGCYLLFNRMSPSSASSGHHDSGVGR